MKKKIIAIGIIGMFLLTCLSAVPVIGKKASAASITEEEIDLKLTVENLEPVYEYHFLRQGFYGYSASIYIKNIGTAALKKSDYPELQIRYTAEYDGEEVFNRTFDSWVHHEIGDSLEPGEEIGWTLRWGDYSDPDLVPPGSTLEVFVDPNNLIPETDENNNHWEEIGPENVAIESAANPLLLNLNMAALKNAFLRLKQMQGLYA